MGVKAAEIAIERSGLAKMILLFFATLSPDYYFPGPGVLVQRDLGLRTVGALDVRNQCSGFIYALSVADQYIKTGMYKTFWLLVRVHSTGLDMTSRGRSVSVIFLVWSRTAF
jgi:3-oxoacyl-[acyl-carrier-protein] synthase-3